MSDRKRKPRKTAKPAVKVPAKRTCTGTTRAGNRCKAAPLKGKRRCSAHDPTAPDATRFGSPEQAGRAGAAPKPRTLKLREVLNARIEAEADAVIDALFSGLEATRGMTIRIGEGMDEIIATPDYSTRLAATREILDRGLGKPRQAVELTGEGGGPIETRSELDLRKLNDEELEQLERILERGEAADAADGA